MHRRMTVALASAAIIVALTGCTSGTPDAQAPTQSPTSQEPAPTPADPLTTVTAVILRPEGLDLRDASGVTVGAVSYDDPAEEIASALETVFDAAPVITEFEAGCCESRPTTIYAWGGFEVQDDHMGNYADDGVTWIPEDIEDDAGMNVHVRSTTAAVGDVEIATNDGFGVDDDAAVLAESLGVELTGDPFQEVLIETGPELESEDTPIPGFVNANSVVLVLDASGGAHIAAPVNLGIGRV